MIIQKKSKMMNEKIKIKNLTYSIFSIFFAFYFIYIKAIAFSSAFIIYSVLFISMYIKSSRNAEKFELIYNQNIKHYLLSIGFMVTWIIIFIVDLKNNFSAFEYLIDIIMGATIIIVSTLYYKLIISSK